MSEEEFVKKYKKYFPSLDLNNKDAVVARIELLKAQFRSTSLQETDLRATLTQVITFLEGKLEALKKSSS